LFATISKFISFYSIQGIVMSRMLRVNNVTFHCQVLGESSEQPPIVLIGGYACDIGIWAPVAEALSKSGRQVLIFDNQGIGKTTDDGEPLTIEGMTKNIHALVEAVGFEAPVVVAGLAMGGMIAQQYAADYPGEVKQLVLLNTVLKFSEAAGKICGEYCDFRKAMDFKAYAGKAHSTLFGANFRTANPAEQFIPFFADILKTVQTAEDQERQLQPLLTADMTAVAAKIQANALVICSGEDVFATPAEGKVLAEQIKTGGAKVGLVTIDGVGHATIVEAFDPLVATMKEFLGIEAPAPKARSSM
jgi:3-oxoadipate enol-lactonase